MPHSRANEPLPIVELRRSLHECRQCGSNCHWLELHCCFQGRQEALVLLQQRQLKLFYHQHPLGLGHRLLLRRRLPDSIRGDQVSEDGHRREECHLPSTDIAAYAMQLHEDIVALNLAFGIPSNAIGDDRKQPLLLYSAAVALLQDFGSHPGHPWGLLLALDLVCGSLELLLLSSEVLLSLLGFLRHEVCQALSLLLAHGAAGSVVLLGRDDSWRLLPAGRRE
mmetsp:Transcript_65472/g.142795  ORF Transcript_65472/g.142795 Transcript_65472/m.142795 type:complete len:223 (+) Transcript_65472:1326-1994(+)